MERFNRILLGGCLCLGLIGCNDMVLVAGPGGGESEQISGDDDSDDDDSDDDERDAVSFREDVHPTFVEDGCHYCHGGPDPYANLPLDAGCQTVYWHLTVPERHDTFFGTGPIIQESDVGNGADSFFVFMAVETVPPPIERIQTYVDWIDQGFVNDCARTARDTRPDPF